MKTLNFYMLIAFLVVLAACSKKVPVSTTDSNKPISYLSSIQNGEITSVNSKETNGKRANVIADRDVAFIARGSDSLGVKSIKVEVIQNGTMEINGQLESEYTNTLSIDSAGQGRNNAYIAGVLRPDAIDQPMILRATSEDYANNTSISPALTVNFISRAEARLSASRSTITRGESVTLTYETDNANQAELNGTQLSTLDGISTKSPTQSKRYILSASNSVSVDRDTVFVNVNQPPSMPNINTFSASPRTITQGQSTTLSWNVSNANSIQISPGNFSSSNSSGNRSFSPNSSTTYTLTAQGPGGTVTDTERVTVNPPPSQIECSTTGTSLFTFSYTGQLPNGNHAYDMNLSSFAAYNNKVITSITNKSNVRVFLWTGGNYVTLNANQSTNAYNGLNVARAWTVITSQQIISPQIEYCTEEL